MATALDDSRDEKFPDTPEGWAQRWKFEFDASKKWLQKYHERGEKIVARFMDERPDATQADGETRWNLFPANVQTQLAMLYGKIPQAAVERRFLDSNDAVARFASEIAERHLNADIERPGDPFSESVRDMVLDRLLPGMGALKARYVADFESVDVPAELDESGAETVAAYTDDKKTREDVEVEYIHWKDQLWSAGARIFREVRWWGFRGEMSREELVERFPEVGEDVPLNSKRHGATKGTDRDEVDAQAVDPGAKADVWEVWDKEHKRVYWYVEGFDKVLDSIDDPYELEGFWPFPRPLMANLTTSTLIPTPDFKLAQDLYDEADSVSTRINKLQRAIKVAGLYDKEMGPDVERLVKECGDNELVAVENWAALVEKGGVKAAIDWLPIEMIVAALDKLRDYRSELIGAIQQITGWSDLMRGQQQENGTPGEAQVKARFASARLQALQDEVARVVSDAMRIKLELVCKFFEPETILERANAQYMTEAKDNPQILQEAVAFLKDKHAYFRVIVKPENISMEDFSQAKAERMEVLGALTSFMQSAAPLAQQMPGAMPFMLELLQWTMAGVRGGSVAESILDSAITASKQAAAMAAQQPPGQPGPDPRMSAVQAKGQLDMQKIQAQTQADLVKTQAETAALAQRRATDAQITLHEEAARRRIESGAPAMPFEAPPPGGMPNGM